MIEEDRGIKRYKYEDRGITGREEEERRRERSIYEESLKERM